MGPAILATGNMRHIHGPPLITPTGPTHPTPDARPWGGAALMYEPPLLLQDSIHRLLVHGPRGLPAQQRPQMPIAERGKLLNQLSELFHPRWISGHGVARNRGRTMQARPSDR